MKILIVDDSPINRKLLRAMLEAENYEVIEAVDGKNALEILEPGGFAAIISDILMPRMDGYRLCLELRMSERHRPLPFIFFTSTYTSPSDEKLALDLGADKFLKKPAPAAQILEALEAVIRSPSHKQPASDSLSAEGDLIQEYSERLVAKLEKKNQELEEKTRSLQASEEQLKLQAAALEHAANAIVITDPKGTILWVNPAFTGMTGYASEEAVGQNPKILRSGKHDQNFYRELWRAILSRRTWRGSFTNKRKDGSLYYGEQTISPVCSSSGAITHFVGIMNDVTERVRAEEELRETHAKLRHLLAHSPAVIYTLRIEGANFVPTVVSENIERVLGVSSAEALRFEWWLNNLHSEDRERVVTNVSDQVKKGGWSLEYRVRHGDGSYRWIEDNNRVVFDASGEPVEAFGVWRDVTNRKQLQQEVAVRQHRLNAFFTGASAGLGILDPALKYVQVNETLAAMNGIPAAGHIGRSVEEIIPEIAAVIVPLIRGVLTTGNPVRHSEISGETLAQPGVTRFWNESFFPISGPAGEVEGVGALVLEITEQKRTEAALRASDEKFRQLAENINEVFWMTNADQSEIVYASPAYERVWGRKVESLYANPKEWRGAILEEDRGKVTALFRPLAEGAAEANAEYRINLPDGSIRWISNRGFPIRNEAGKVFRLGGVATDVTEKKRLEAQALRAQRVESIGTLAGGIAHDLNNVLAPILMSLSILRDELTDESSKEMMDVLATSAQRGANMVKQLLTFSRGIEGHHAPVNLTHLIREMQSILRQTLPKNIQIRTAEAEDLWPVSGDVTQLHQVLLNLCVNARDAMPYGGTILIKSTRVLLDEQFAGMSPEGKPGPHVVLSVSDTGTGMAPEIRERIFDPFFTTKPVDKGTGLGLSTVQGIVKSHGGFITVYSEVGKGTEFKIYLPAQPEGAPEGSNKNALELPLGRGELILVVDDEESIRLLTRKTLGFYGYQVLTANDGAQAVAVCAQHLSKIDLVLTDLAMPLMDGAATVRAVRTLNPNMKIIAASGLDSDGKNSPHPFGVNAFLQKPFTAERLLRTIRAVLDSLPIEQP